LPSRFGSIGSTPFSIRSAKAFHWEKFKIFQGSVPEKRSRSVLFQVRSGSLEKPGATREPIEKGVCLLQIQVTGPFSELATCLPKKRGRLSVFPLLRPQAAQTKGGS